MSNVLLAWNNACDDGATFSDTSGTASKLGQAQLAQQWDHLASPAPASFTATMVGTPTIALVAVCSHNWTLAATVRVRGFSGGGGTLYDSGTISPWPAGVQQAWREGLRCNWVHKLSSATAAASWQVDVNDAANPAGFVRAGRFFAATNVWQPTINMQAGAGLGWESNYTTTKALSGAEWFVDVEPHRVARFSLANLATDEMLRNAFDLQRVAAGARREVVWQYDPADVEHAIRRTVFGRLRQLSAIEEPYFALMKTAFEVKELL
jgi:hypothetical protein